MRNLSTLPLTVGIPVSKLRAHSPRGVVRVARAIAQELVDDASLRLLAISNPFFEQNDILVEAWEMRPWLAAHSLDISIPTVGKRMISDAMKQTSLNLLKRTIIRAGLREPARRALHLTKRCIERWQRTTARPPLGERFIAGDGADCHPHYRSLRQLDAIVSFECYDAIWDWPVELFDCRMIGIFHDAIPLRINEGRSWNPAGFYCAAGRMANRAAAIACDSESSQHDLHAFFSSTQGKTRVVYLGHDRERFLPRAPDARESNCRAMPAKKSPGKRIAMIGEIERRKNQAGVLRACQRLAADNPNDKITLVLIGKQAPCNPYEFLEKQARKFVNVEHLGYVSDDKIGDVLRSCDAFVYPSLWEGFGIPVLEAMSAGVPVVCSKNSSLTEVGGELAFYCDPYDPVSIAEAIRKALDMPAGQRQEWVRAARQRAAAFTWSAAAANITRLIRETCAPKPIAHAPNQALEVFQSCQVLAKSC